MTNNLDYGETGAYSGAHAGERIDVTGMRQSSNSGNGTTSLIDHDSFFNGTYRSPHDLRIEGEFEGEIHCEGTVIVAERARVSGTINAGSVLISGSVAGHVSCADRFEVLSAGQVAAAVRAGTVVIREGAVYEGEMRMHQEPEGLPQREYSGGVVRPPIESAFSGPGRQEPGAVLPGGHDADPATNGAGGREQSDTPALRAVTEG